MVQGAQGAGYARIIDTPLPPKGGREQKNTNICKWGFKAILRQESDLFKKPNVHVNQYHHKQ